MSDKDLARRTELAISFDGVDISDSVQPYFLSATYTDNEEDEADDFQLTVQDRDGVWLTKWLNDAIQAAASSPDLVAVAGVSSSSSSAWAIGDAVIANGQPQYTSYGGGTPGSAVTNYRGTITHLNLRDGVPYPIHVGKLGWFAINQVVKAGVVAGVSTTTSSKPKIKGLRIQASFVRQNWQGDGKDTVLNCGRFELDSVRAAGPPASIVIKGTALPFSNAQIRQTKKSRAWEYYTLKGIAQEMASKAKMKLMFESRYNPSYKRVEQVRTSDITFLSRLAHDAGISLKITDNIIVLFDQRTYEAMPPVLTIRRGDGSYTKWDLTTGEADRKYASCRVRYFDPGTGATIEGIAYADDYDPEAENNQQLEITAKVGSIAEAKDLAEKHLRLRNKYEKSAIFVMTGNPILVAGVTVMLEDWGAWSGKYIIKQAKHTVGSSGYTTQIRLRPVLGGY